MHSNVSAADVRDEGRVESLEASMYALMNNMPVMAFSKNAQDGKYLACNQLFAEFLNKKCPEEVVGLTVYDVYEKASVERFVSHDMAALSMDEPYISFEDAEDANGSPRRLQTARLTFVDEAGRLCILGTCIDVTEMVRAKEEGERARADFEEAVSASAVYQSIVAALSQDYFDLYYVDVVTDEYVEYGSRTKKDERTKERRGTDFFAECRENAVDFVYGEDLERILEALDKTRLIAEVEKNGAYNCQYRLLIDGAPTYVNMKATRISGDDKHIIIGVSNVDAQVRDHMAASRAAEDRKSYLRLSALAGNLIVLYYVDPESSEYTEYNATTSFESLGIAKQGLDFFESSYENGLRTIHPEDQELFRSQVTRENVLATIDRNGVFVLDYRLMSGDLPTYVRLKAVLVEEDGKEMMIVGLLDEDAQIRQERDYLRNLSAARELATIDSLTGVKNKHAYSEWEEIIDAAIKTGEQEPFAVVVCDVNGLKTVNDRYGHNEGDACIKKACARICGVYEHSPVFRVGGDEFAVILTKGDYERRAQLLDTIVAVPQEGLQAMTGETIAAGMADYRRGRHSSLSSVFEEADKAMYSKKRSMKKSSSLDDYVPDASEQIPAMNVRKHILIADDIEMNREILGDLLEDDYDIIYAADGVETLEKLRKHKDEVALVLLDLYMPRMTGREVIAEMQIDEDLMSIPVVFLTVDQEAELDCLRIGAMDFIPKPCPDIEIVKARIAKCIELSEDRELIRHTERDKLTGLLNKEFFYRYVERLDRIHEEDALDAVVCDVNKLHAINERYSRQFGDHVLHNLGAGIRKLARQIDGIGCREGGDTFLLYCPHRDDYEQLLRTFLDGVFADQTMARRVTLRFGVFSDAQQEPDVEERFVRAKTAADSVKADARKTLAFYRYAPRAAS
ncbi:MAG: diguanylate cyclase [Atopobiaceae bacterium]|nr:diguanylate cyclase [Atopobiaceae bacterium]